VATHGHFTSLRRRSHWGGGSGGGAAARGGRREAAVEEEEWTGVCGRRFICVRLRRGGNPSWFLDCVAGLAVQAHTARFCDSDLRSLWPIIRARHRASQKIKEQDIVTGLLHSPFVCHLLYMKNRFKF
jgi:hypothetical protein